MKVLATLFRAFSLTMMMIHPSTPITVYMEMVFNNGLAPKVAEPCNMMDNILINSCFAGTGARQLLRASTNTTAELHQVHRQEYPLICKDLCAGCAPKTCRARQCSGFRRELEQGESQSRDLYVDWGMCNRTVAQTHSCIDRQFWTLSATCKAFYDPKLRKGTCRLFDIC